MSYKYGGPSVAGAYHYGAGGLGVLGSAIPSAGTDGASFIYNDLVLPGDAGKEYRGLIITPPSGTAFFYEDGSFTYTGSASTFVYELFEDGVSKGTATATIAEAVTTTTVINTIPASYNLRGVVTKTQPSAYNLRGSVTLQLPASYALLSSTTVVMTMPASYNLRGSVVALMPASYSLLADGVSAVIMQMPASYSLRGVVLEKYPASYRIGYAPGIVSPPYDCYRVIVKSNSYPVVAG